MMIGSYKIFKNIADIKETVHTVVTSPPYYNQRKYGDASDEIGREKTVEEYVDKLVAVFDSIPLDDQGSIWVNMGDKRHSSGSLLMVPEQFAIKMMQSGWIVLDKVVWAKIVDFDDGTTVGGCMTEPAKYRLNANGHEFLYRFAKSKKAWSDTCAVAIPRQENEIKGKESTRYMPEELMQVHTSVEGRNLHNVWRTKMGQTQKKHYAVYPSTLCERPIAMTCPMRVCTECGHLSTREIVKEEYDEGRGDKRVFGKYNSVSEEDNESGRMDCGRKYIPRKPVTTGWSDCGHKAWGPGVVLDPFCGSGTTGEVALKMGRSFIGVDIYDAFIDITKQRCFETVAKIQKAQIDPWQLAK